MATLPLRTLALLATLALLPAAEAATFSFGTVVGKTDSDFTPAPEAKPAGLCTVDINSDGNPGLDDTLYLDLSGPVSGADFCVAAGGSPAGAVAVDDIRIYSGSASYASGSPVTLTDDDYRVQKSFTRAVPHFIRYLDADADAKFKGVDTMYVDVSNLAGKIVSVGDVRLTPFGKLPAGSRVAPGDPDMNSPLREISGAGVTFGSPNIVYKAASAFYLNTDGHALATSAAYGRDYVVEENDVRLNAKAENPLGDFNAPSFTVSDATVVSSKVVAGKWLHLKVTMKNTGKAAASALVETYVDDVLVDSRGTATIAPGKEGSVVISLPAPEEAGRAKLRVGKDALVFYTVEAASAAGGVSTSSLEAEAAPDTTAVEPVTAKASPRGAPGAPLLAMLGLVGVLAWMRRRAD